MVIINLLYALLSLPIIQKNKGVDKVQGVATAILGEFKNY